MVSGKSRKPIIILYKKPSDDFPFSLFYAAQILRIALSEIVFTGVSYRYTQRNCSGRRIIISAFAFVGRLRFSLFFVYATQFLRPLRAEKRPLTASEKSDSITISSAALRVFSENAQ